MDTTDINPPVPFTKNIIEGLQPGRVIVLHGFIPHTAHRFRVDLTYGDSIAFHIAPRFDEGCIVRNHYDGGWGGEERHPSGLGGLMKGQTFEMMILTDYAHFKLAIAGRHYTEFAHRLPFQNVQKLEVSGDVQLYRVEFRINYSPPSYPPLTGFPIAVCPSGPPLVPQNVSKHKPVYNPALPLKYHILGGLQNGNVIMVSGRPTNSPHRFTINLRCGSHSGDIALHLNPRFDQGCVVRNSFIGNCWGAEDRIGIFPFQPAVNFDWIIRVFPSCFSLTINGHLFGTFTHRLYPLNRVDTLDVDGDVIVSFLQIQ